MSERMARGDVPDWSVEQLRQQFDDVLLLDTRERAEYEVSHLPGAVWIGYEDFDPNRLPTGLDPATKIVTYCSVGYRSERIGEQLQAAGFTDVHNLRGSIFEWANAGYPVVDAQNQPTQNIHGYNKKWGRWVRTLKVVYD